MEQSDTVLREIPILLARDTTGSQLSLLSCPLRPPWRGYPFEQAEALRMKPASRRLEVDLPLDTESVNYAGHDEAHRAQGMDKITLRSTPVEARTSLAVGALQDGALVLAPLEQCMQLRPHLAHLNTTKTGKGAKDEDGEEGGGGEEEDHDEEPALKAVEVQVQKRETERQIQARINSYAYIAQKEEEEPWKPLQVHPDDSDAADKLWDKLLSTPLEKDGTKHLEYLDRMDYLHNFVPAIGGAAMGSDPAGTSGPKRAGGTANQPEIPASSETVSDAANVAFIPAMKSLFQNHSVCSMANVRQWLQDPKGGGSGPAKEAATLTDQALNRMVLGVPGLDLACIRRMYVLRTTGRPEQDPFRRVVVDLLQDKESLKRHDIMDAANRQNLAVTDTLYNKVVKDLCVSRNQAWTLKYGADMP